MEYQRLAELYAQVEGTRKRLEKTHAIAQFLKDVPNEELEHVVLLLQARAFPSWEKETLGIAARVMVRTLAQVLGTTEKLVEEQWKNTGDLGVVAEGHAHKRSQQLLFKESLSVEKVFRTIRKIASTEGSGSIDTKVKLLSELFSQAEASELRYLVRTVLEDLRIGLAEGTLRDAIVWANFPEACPPSPDAEPPSRDEYKRLVQLAQDAYDRTNDFAKVAALARSGEDALAAVKLTVGRPVKVMLATREPSFEKAFERTGVPAQLEYKYDGFRMQVHKNGEQVTMYTRRLEDVTAAFPDLVEIVRERVHTDCILDGEAIGVDPSTGRYVPFQQISQRIRRKHRIEELAKELPMQLVVFDVLVWNGEEVLAKPLHERIAHLHSAFATLDERFSLATSMHASTVDEANDFFKQAKAAGCEGVMVKKLDAPYRPGARVGDWVKQKETMENLDLIIVGAEWGEGKRSGWLTSFELAVRGDDGEFLTVGRVGTGLKELPTEGFSFGELTELLRPHIEFENGRSVVLAPAIVVEVAFEEIQKSPSYGSGYALRFPRIVRSRADERGADDVTSLSYLEQLFAQQ